MNPCNFAHPIFDEGAKKKKKVKKRQPLKQMLLGKVVIFLKKTETRSMHQCLSPVLLSSQSGLRTLISDLKTLKQVQGRAGNTLESIGIGKDFLVELKWLSN
jgi:hypothetical protein